MNDKYSHPVIVSKINCEKTRGGKGHSPNILWGQMAQPLKPVPYFNQKSVVFPTLFQT